MTPASVLVADTGLDLDDPAFAGRILPNGKDLIGTNTPGDTKPDNDPSDPLGGSGHGTAVAGVLAAVAPNARFEALRTCWDGDQCYQYIQAEAIELAADRGVKVVSMSWLSGELEPDLRKAITSHPEMLFVGIPSGNGGSFNADPEDPQPCNAAPNVCVSTAADNDGLDCGAFGPKSVEPRADARLHHRQERRRHAEDRVRDELRRSRGGRRRLDPVRRQADGHRRRGAQRVTASARKVPAWAGKSVSGGIVDAAAAVETLKNGAPPNPEPAAFSASISRAGHTIRIRATGEATVTGLMYKNGKYNKQFNDAALVDGILRVRLGGGSRRATASIWTSRPPTARSSSSRRPSRSSDETCTHRAGPVVGRRDAGGRAADAGAAPAKPAAAIRTGGPSLPGDAKVALALNPKAKGFRVTDASGAVVLTGRLAPRVGSPAPWKRAAAADLSAITTPGTYRVRVGKVISRPWEVRPDASSAPISTILQYFATNTDERTHLNDGVIASGPKQGKKVNLVGGWMDAGDTLKFTHTIAYATAALVASARMDEADADALLEQADVGVRWLVKAHPEPGLFIAQVGDGRDHEIGFRDPRHRRWLRPARHRRAPGVPRNGWGRRRQGGHRVGLPRRTLAERDDAQGPDRPRA